MVNDALDDYGLREYASTLPAERRRVFANALALQCGFLGIVAVCSLFSMPSSGNKKAVTNRLTAKTVAPRDILATSASKYVGIVNAVDSLGADAVALNDGVKLGQAKFRLAWCQIVVPFGRGHGLLPILACNATRHPNLQRHHLYS